MCPHALLSQAQSHIAIMYILILLYHLNFQFATGINDKLYTHNQVLAEQLSKQF